MQKLCLILLFCCFENINCVLDSLKDRATNTGKIQLLSESELKETIVNVFINLHFEQFFYQRRELYKDIINCFYKRVEKKVLKIFLKKNLFKDIYIESQYAKFFFNSMYEDLIKKEFDKILLDFFKLSLNISKFVFDVVEVSNKDFVVTMCNDFNRFSGREFGFETVSLLLLSKKIKEFYKNFHYLYSDVSGIKLSNKLFYNGETIEVPLYYHDRKVVENVIENFDGVFIYFDKNMHEKIKYINIRFYIEQLCLKLLILHKKKFFFNQIEIKYDEQFKNRLIFWEVVVCDFYMKDEVKRMNPQDRDYYFYKYIRIFNKKVLPVFTFKKLTHKFGVNIVNEWIDDLSKCNYQDSDNFVLNELNFSKIKKYLNVRELYCIPYKNKIPLICSDYTSLFLFESVRYFLRQGEFVKKVQNISVKNLLNIINNLLKKENFCTYDDIFFISKKSYKYKVYQYHTDIAFSMLNVYDYLYIEFLQKLEDKSYQINIVESLDIEFNEKQVLYKAINKVDFCANLWKGVPSKKFYFTKNEEIYLLFYYKISEKADSFLQENFSRFFTNSLLRLVALIVYDYYGVEFGYEDRLKFCIDSEGSMKNFLLVDFHNAFYTIYSQVNSFCKSKDDFLTFSYKHDNLSEETLNIYKAKYKENNINDFLRFLNYPEYLIECDAFLDYPKDHGSFIAFFVYLKHWFFHDTFFYAIENFKLEKILSNLSRVVEKFLKDKYCIV